MSEHADKKIEALNRITREVKKALPEWEKHLRESNYKGWWDSFSDDQKREKIIFRIYLKDIEVKTEIKNLIETIINEIEESDES